MKKKTKPKSSKSIRLKTHSSHMHKGGSGIYFLGFIGAVIYYLSTATGFWHGVLGILKAIIWPLFLVFEVLKFVGAP